MCAVLWYAPVLCCAVLCCAMHVCRVQTRVLLAACVTSICPNMLHKLAVQDNMAQVTVKNGNDYLPRMAV